MTAPFTRAEVYSAIDSERAYQHKRFPDANTLGETLALVQKHTTLAVAAYTKSNTLPALEYLRKIAGLCVRGMEENGAPQRAGHEHYHERPIPPNTVRAQVQVQNLADFIIREMPGEPSESEGAVDTAIRVMRGNLDLRERLEDAANSSGLDKETAGWVRRILAETK